MHTVTDLPYEVREDTHQWIPVADGVRLAARIWRPVGSDENPVPALLEMIPYRHNDLTAHRDSIHHPYLAGHGYACVRVDLRGSGQSEGILTDEYLSRELADAQAVLAWIAAQPWCTSRMGMMGISWGGFNALQVAARRPPGLDAIVTLSSTDDRYSDDVHYMGGCLLADNLSWASTMFAYNSCPPDPAIVGTAWRDMWHARLDYSGVWLEDWLIHQRRDEYWQHGSVCEDYDAIGCPVLAVSGWADGYSNAVFRLLRELDVPRKGIIGPWSHKYPHLGVPGPAIGFLQELVRWWDHWLKDVANGVMDEPMLTVWMQDSVAPQSSYDQRPGRWVGEPEWPSPHLRVDDRPLARFRIAARDEAIPDEELTIRSPLSVGQYAGKWCSYGVPPDLPLDQREEDGASLTFDTDKLDEPLELLGSPVAVLDIAADRPVAMVAVRLSDVAPDGRATRISYGLLNLTHRDGHDRPKPLVPGRRYRVAVGLNYLAQSIAPRHRLRLAVSSSYWPLAWPSPEPTTLSVFTGSSRLRLPIRPKRDEDLQSQQPFEKPEGTTPVAVTQLVDGEQAWHLTHDLVNYASALEIVKDQGTFRLDGIDLEISRRAYERYSWVRDDVESVRGETEWVVAFKRGDWQTKSVTRTILTSTAAQFELRAELDAYEGDRRVASSTWNRVIDRDLV